MEDRDIVALYQERSEDALKRTEEMYGAFCRSLAFRILQDRDEAAECVSDAYLVLWNTIPPENPQSLRAFLCRITRNLALNRLEKQTAQKRGGTQRDLVLEELSACVPARDETETLTEDIVVRDTLNRFLRALSRTERWMFMRRYWYGDAVKEIASACNTTENRVYVVLHRTRKKLKERLEKEGIVL